jgi:hypothetical protein
MKLIPNGITVTEQFALRSKLDSIIDKWLHDESTPFIIHSDKSVAELERVSGIRCTCLGNNGICGYELVDEKKYAWFMLKWS